MQALAAQMLLLRKVFHARVFAGGAISVAYDGNALTTSAQAREQIMLTGGVLTSMAMSRATFNQFEQNRTTANGVFTVNEDVLRVAPGDVFMHAVFCYGWWDNPRALNDGYWICKNRLAMQAACMPRYLLS
jgi:hypothetical protein